MNKLVAIAAAIASTAVVTIGVTAQEFDPLEATNAIIADMDAETRANSDAYFTGGYWLIGLTLAFNILVTWILLRFGISARIRDFSERITSFKGVHVLFYVPIYVVVSTFIALPWTYYTGFFREHQYGFSTQTFMEWLNDERKSLFIMMIIATALLSIIYFLIRRLPRNWWQWTSGALIAFMAFAMFASPIYIEPMFNEYKSMDEGPLKEDILQIARANGVPADDVKQVDHSKQHNRVSANVAGFGSTMRIALNDNLINRASPDAVKAVMAHEIGHYVLNHLYKMMAIMLILIFLGGAFVHFATSRLIARHGRKWGVRDLADPAGIPLLLLMFGVWMTAITPITNSMIRSSEAEADLFAINATQDPDSWVEVVLLTAEYRKAAPGKWEEILFYDHPSPHSRILMAMEWKAEYGGKETPPPPEAETGTENEAIEG